QPSRVLRRQREELHEQALARQKDGQLRRHRMPRSTSKRLRKRLLVKKLGRQKLNSRQHWARLASRSAAAFTAAEAFGYLRLTSLNDAQACSLAPSACRLCPSLSKASGARVEFG